MDLIVILSPTFASIRSAVFWSIRAIFEGYDLRSWPSNALGAPGRAGSTPIKETSTGSSLGFTTTFTLLKAIGPASAIPSMRRVRLYFL